MSEDATNPKLDRPALPRDAYRTQRAATPASRTSAIQPVVVTPHYEDPVAPRPRPDAPKPATAVHKESRNPPREGWRRNPFEGYGERTSQRPYALRLPDPIDLLLRQHAAEERTQPLRIVDRALYDYFKRLGRLPPTTE
ncbi:hypothetical protein ACO2RV_21740 [Ancylobacter sp. VNQ12]|uniref:hypothetical protein n=1 Tax=Ancylobacter sp. VNQ12 TaxID=3400920 RepID=UPI003C08D7B8